MKARLFSERWRLRLPRLVFLLIAAQPILDIASYWELAFGLSSLPTLLIRGILLLFSLFTGFSLSDRKRSYLILGGVLAVLTALHVYACLQNPNGYREPISDLSNLVRIFYLPIMAFCFATFQRKNEWVFSSAQLAMTVSLLVISFVMLFGALTGTGSRTYPLFGTGTLGWFYLPNSQSVILSMLLPLALSYTLQHWPDRVLPSALIALVGCGALYALGTRLAYASLVCAPLALALCLLLIDRWRRKQAAAIALVACLFAALYPLSAVRENIVINENRSNELRELIEASGLRAGPENSAGAYDEETVGRIEAIYRSRREKAALIDRFGRDRVLQSYGYSLDPELLRDMRRTKILFCRFLIEDSAAPARLFGLNLSEMSVETWDENGEPDKVIFDVENDYHAIYFLTGGVGLFLMLLFLLGICLRTMLAVLRQPKERFTLPTVGCALACGICLIQAYFTACVLRQPSASIYLAFVLSSLWVLADEKKNAITEEGETA